MILVFESINIIKMEFIKCGKVNCECGIVIVPVQSVDGIDCDVRLVKNLQGKITLVLESKKCCVIDEEMDSNSYTYFNDFVTLEDLKQVLSSLRFNKLTNRFQTTPVFDWNFLECDSVKLFEKCCVCYERTQSKTTCNHSICIPCFDKIKYVNMETKCPLCRQDCSIE